MSEELKSKLSSLNQEILSVQGDLEKVLSELFDLEKRRKTLLSRLRELKAEAKMYKDRLGVLKEEIGRLNETLRDLRRERSEKIFSFKGLRERMREHLREKPRPQTSEEKLEAEISKLEWMIQTTPLPLAEEKKVIEKIKSLEEQLQFYKELKSMKNEAQIIERSIMDIEEKINSCINVIAEKISEKRNLRERLSKIFGEINTMKLELEKIDEEYRGKREKILELRSKHKNLINQITVIRRTIKEEEEKKKKEQKMALKEKIRKEVSEKIEEGKKVTLEELKVFLGEDEEDSI